MITVESIWKLFSQPEQRATEILQLIQQEGLSKAEALTRFDTVVGVADLSLEIARGEIFCIMGLSGSGKSTLVRHFNRLLEPTAGRIIIDGTDVMQLSPSELRQFQNETISMVFQNFALLPHRSVLDNVALPLEIRKVNKNERLKQARAILQQVELEAWANKFAHELSGGMQQRVGLARALAADPDVLLMDEPFSALDPLIRRQLQDEFLALSSELKKTTIFITHDLDEAVRIGDRIAIMRDGRVIQVGTPEEIVMQPADDYVAEFVAGISRLKVVRAHAIMTPIHEYQSKYGALSQTTQRVAVDDSLSRVIHLSLESDHPILVQENGKDVGVVDRETLLKTVIEGTDIG